MIRSKHRSHRRHVCVALTCIAHGRSANISLRAPFVYPLRLTCSSSRGRDIEAVVMAVMTMRRMRRMPLSLRESRVPHESLLQSKQRIHHRHLHTHQYVDAVAVYPPRSGTIVEGGDVDEVLYAAVRCTVR